MIPTAAIFKRLRDIDRRLNALSDAELLAIPDERYRAISSIWRSVRDSARARAARSEATGSGLTWSCAVYPGWFHTGRPFRVRR